MTNFHRAPPVSIELPVRTRTRDPQQEPRAAARSASEEEQSVRSFYMARQRAQYTPSRTSSYGTSVAAMLTTDQLPREPPPAYRARARPGELDFPPSYEEPPTYDEVWHSVIRSQTRPHHNAEFVSSRHDTIEMVGRIAIHHVNSVDSESPLQTVPALPHATPATKPRNLQSCLGYRFWELGVFLMTCGVCGLLIWGFVTS